MKASTGSTLRTLAIAAALFAVVAFFYLRQPVARGAAPPLQIDGVVGAETPPTLASLRGKWVVLEFWAYW